MDFNCRLLARSWLRVAPFTLRTNGKDQDDVDQWQVSIQRDVPAWSTANQQFPLVVAGGTANQGVVRQHIQSADNPAPPGLGAFDLVLLKRVHDPIEVIDDTGSKPDAWHLIDPACAPAGASQPSPRAGP